MPAVVDRAREWVSEKAAYLAETREQIPSPRAKIADKRARISEALAENKLQTHIVMAEYEKAEELAAELGRPDRYVREQTRESAENCIDIRYWELADAHIQYGGFDDLRERMEEEAYDAVTERFEEDRPSYSGAAEEAVRLHREYGLIGYDRLRKEARDARDRALEADRIGDGIELTWTFNLDPAPVDRHISEDDDHNPVRTTAEEEVAERVMDGLLDGEGDHALDEPRYVFVDEDVLTAAFHDHDIGHAPEHLAADTAAYLQEQLPLDLDSFARH